MGAQIQGRRMGGFSLTLQWEDQVVQQLAIPSPEGALPSEWNHHVYPGMAA